MSQQMCMEDCSRWSVGQSLRNIPTVVDRILHINRDNGYAVAMMRPTAPGTVNEFKACGTIGEVAKGERLLLSGEWKNDKKYGPQLSVTDVAYPDPSTAGMYSFLVGEFVKGITRQIGEGIWREFGEEAGSIIEEDPERLLTVKGIGKARMNQIVESWQDIASKRNAMVFLSQMKLTKGIVARVLKRWANPEAAVELLMENPYRLAWEIKGVSFPIADEAARAIGFDIDHPHRFDSAVAYILYKAEGEGHCYLPYPDLIERAWEYMKLPEDDIRYAEFSDSFSDYVYFSLERMQNEKIMIVHGDGNERLIYSMGLFMAEAGLARALHTLTQQKWNPIDRFDDLIAAYERNEGITALDEDQKEAIKMALENQLSVISGGPGTGKTTIIKALRAMFMERCAGISIAMCAPTGRAAKRMSESTGAEASTIHRLLGMVPGEGFYFNKSNPLPAEVVICDESSMLDVSLAKSLAEAIRPGCRLILCGDVNQLPSVGPGNVLKDIIACGFAPLKYLTHIHRQAPDSFIAQNATSIHHGNLKAINLTNKTSDFFWISVDKLPGQANEQGSQQSEKDRKEESIREWLVKSVMKLRSYGQDMHDIQVLCPQYKGNVGVNALNALIQDVFNPDGRVVYQDKIRMFKIGDKVMQTKNDYEKEVFNGDQGTIVQGSQDGLVVVFDGREVVYPPDEVSELALSYVMTIHKAQGSESRSVIQILSTGHYTMLQRPILYTGVTRAKERCILIGEWKALAMAVNNNTVAHRNTGLTRFIRRYKEKSVLSA